MIQERLEDIIQFQSLTGGFFPFESKFHIMGVLQTVLKKYPQKIILVVTHDADLRKIADKLYFIKDGEISFELNKQEIIEKYDESAEFKVNETIASERFFKEYRELEYMIRDKLEKFSKTNTKEIR